MFPSTASNITSLPDFPRHAYAVYVGGNNVSAVQVLVPNNRSLEKASTQARNAGYCTLAAVNGGPFHADGTSLGLLVRQGQVIQDVPDEGSAASLVGFGRQQRQRQNNDTPSWYWVFGAPPPAHDHLDFYLTTFGWLVYNGTNVVDDNDNNPTGAHRAPRTAVGVRRDGQLVFVVADGCEKW